VTVLVSRTVLVVRSKILIVVWTISVMNRGGRSPRVWACDSQGFGWRWVLESSSPAGYSIQGHRR
jgi:hypothetical protein